MTTDKFLPYGRQSIDDFDIRELSEALADPIITRGPRVEAFEKAVAEKCEAHYAVSFCNGTAALHAAQFAAGIGEYDLMVTTPNTFVGTVVGGVHAGAALRFTDIDRDSGNIDLDILPETARFTSTRGRLFVVPVHFAGIALEMGRLASTIAHSDVVIIEDAAHALGSRYPDGRPVGSCGWSDMTCFSFHPVKTITTGEGGVVTTNSEELHQKLLSFRSNGIHRVNDPERPWYYEVREITGNYHMTDFQAALGLSQLKRLDQFGQSRLECMQAYRQELSGVEGIRMFDPKYDERTVYHLCVLQIDFENFGKSRAEVMNELKAEGIGTQVHYIPLYHHPAVDGDPLTQMEDYYEQALSFPLFAELTTEDVKRVCKTLKKVLNI